MSGKLCREIKLLSFYCVHHHEETAHTYDNPKSDGKHKGLEAYGFHSLKRETCADEEERQHKALLGDKQGLSQATREDCNRC